MCIMKKYFYYLLILFIFFGAGCFTSQKSNPIHQDSSKIDAKEGVVIDKANSAEEILKSMTLEQKIGQMFLIGFWGSNLNNHIQTMIDDYHIGGVILLKYNAQNKSQLQNLIQNIQDRNEQKNLTQLPLFIATDQEGGLVTKIKVKGVKEFTAQKNIHSTTTAYQVGQRRGQELTSLGINLNFSPVLDYTPNPQAFLYSRTFRGKILQITDLSSSLIKGYQKQGLIATGKHFLGHPNNKIDPHHSILSGNFNNLEIKERIDLFKQVIQKSDPGMVMISHVKYKTIDPKNACSLSKSCIQKLRQDASFSEVIITDDLEMGAIQKQYSNKQIPIQAVQAGEDVLLYVSTFSKQKEAYKSLLKAVQDGKISEDRINQSVLRIIKLKQKYLIR